MCSEVANSQAVVLPEVTVVHFTVSCPVTLSANTFFIPLAFGGSEMSLPWPSRMVCDLKLVM